MERSADGQAFRGIGTVPGAGNSSRRTAYESHDEQPLPGTSYYRLRQTDIDGTTSFSPVRSVKVGNSAGALEVYPGRAAQEWVVSSTLPAEVVSGKAAAVQVFDAVGRVQRIACTPDASLAGRWTLDTHTLPAGIYIVRLLTASGSYSQRIAK
ncbi:T9SS type A sorting domain-containing protein [Hymenobacter humi]|uniref:T9SS type A sorting domain-containing protein n=1 Tax=Hymenobacter humi TaxID=1411620 RepID=A0ABW2U3H5_9BACT